MLCVFCKMCGGMRCQGVCFVCGITCDWIEGSEILFCVRYNMCCGVRRHSVPSCVL